MLKLRVVADDVMASEFSLGNFPYHLHLKKIRHGGELKAVHRALLDSEGLLLGIRSPSRVLHIRRWFIIFFHQSLSKEDSENACERSPRQSFHQDLH